MIIRTIYCIVTKELWKIQQDKIEKTISFFMYFCLFFSLYIQNESDDNMESENKSFKGSAHHLIQVQDYQYSSSLYRNPFREFDLSSFPKDLLDELSKFPFLQQIAILRDPYLQQKYFPQYCSS